MPVSTSREETVVCPGCATPGPMRLYSQLDAALEPALKEELLRGRLSVFACPKCGRASRIVHPLLYVDASRELLVQLDPEGTVDVAALAAKLPADGGARARVSRVVRDGNALIEKVRIHDAGLDDRVMEVWKLLLAVTHAEYAGVPWYFERAESADAAAPLLFTIVTAKGPHGTRRPRAEYEALSADLARRGALAPGEAFAKVDRDFARTWLEGPGGVTLTR